MPFWAVLLIALLLAGLIIWGVQSLNPHGFNAAAKTAVGNAEKGIAAGASKAAAGVASAASKVQENVKPAAK